MYLCQRLFDFVPRLRRGLRVRVRVRARAYGEDQVRGSVRVCIHLLISLADHDLGTDMDPDIDTDK